MQPIEIIGIALGWVGTIVGFVRANLYARRAKKAEVHSSEIAIADQMIDLVKKANAEALELNRKENDKLRKSISKLEKAVRSISSCPHRDQCPITDQLQEYPTVDGKPPDTNDR